MATYLLFGSAAFIATFRYERGSGFWFDATLGHIASLPFAAMVFRLYNLRLDFTTFVVLGVLVSPISGEGASGGSTVLADGDNHALQPEASARQH